AAEAELTTALHGGSPDTAPEDVRADVGTRRDVRRQAGMPASPRVTCSELLALLPPDEAAQLRRLRRELLGSLVALQATYGQATAFLRSAQVVVRRLAAVMAPQTAAYGPRGERTLPRPMGRRQSLRWA